MRTITSNWKWPGNLELWFDYEMDTCFIDYRDSSEFYYYAPYYGEDKIMNDCVNFILPEGAYVHSVAARCEIIKDIVESGILTTEEAIRYLTSHDNTIATYIPNSDGENVSDWKNRECICSSKALFDGFGYDAECPIHGGKM